MKNYCDHCKGEGCKDCSYTGYSLPKVNGWNFWRVIEFIAAVIVLIVVGVIMTPSLVWNAVKDWKWLKKLSMSFLLIGVLLSCKTPLDPVLCDVKLPDNVRVAYNGEYYHAQVYTHDGEWDFIKHPGNYEWYNVDYPYNPTKDSCEAKAMCFGYVEYWKPKPKDYGYRGVTDTVGLKWETKSVNR